MKKANLLRIGIFAGSFDPVHKGHIAFALKAVQEAKLDEVYFLPEIRPRGKAGVTHIAHRIAMLKLALKPYPALKVLELPDAQFTTVKTLPKLQQKFKGSTILLLLGSNTANPISTWPNIETLLEQTGLIIGIHQGQSFDGTNLPIEPQELFVFASPEPGLSSSRIRKDIGENGKSKNLLPSLRQYAKKHWLYSVVTPKSSA
jgi:nicotinate-nucleotide adenylyltransferase